MKVTMIPIVIDALDIVTKGLVLGPEDLEITRQVETIKTTAFFEQPEYKNPEDLRRLAVTQTPEENHQLTLV